MKKNLLLAVLFVATHGFSQCPFPAQLNTTGSCPGATLSIATSNTLTQIVWYDNTSAVTTAPLSATYKPVAAGVYTAQLTDNTGCQSTTNAITIDPLITPGISISQSAATVCSGQPAFIALPVNAGASPDYQWQVNGKDAGTNSTVFTAASIPPHAVVTCLLTSNAACPTMATTASNPVTAITPPVTGLTGNGNYCPGDTLVVSANDPLEQIIWKEGTTALTTVMASLSTGSAGVTVAGDNGAGANANQFNFPEGVFTDANGNIYVSDAANFRVQKWSPGATSGVTVAGGNGAGAALNQINGPTGIFVDAGGTVYVADFGNHQVEKWTPGAGSGMIVAGGNGQGSAANQLNSPTGVFVDGSGNVFVADHGNNRVQKWATGATSGVTVAGGNGQGSNPNQLFLPAAVYVDANKNVYVSDEYNNRVQKWTPGATSGVTVAGGNGQGSAANQLSYPSGIYVDGNGNVFIGDQYNNRIQEWTPGAGSGVTVAGGNGPGAGANQFNQPADVYLDNTGDLYIADYNNNRIQKWTLQSTIDTAYITSTGGTYTATVTSNIGCAATSKEVVVNPTITPSVNISAQATAVCQGNPITFNASPVNGGTTPVYQWQVNGVNTGTNNAAYSSNTLANGDTITCVITSNATCPAPPTALSNSIPLTIEPLPQLGAGQTFYLAEGQSITLDPGLTGNSSGYSFSWSPGTSLSDSTTADPVASPTKTTVYTMTATSAEGCEASTKVSIAIFTKLHVPNAFTPNGDGHNDVFYILNGPPDSQIKDLSVYDRWGEKVFQAHNAPTADPAFGWNGNYKGAPAPAGTYVYVLSMQFSDGTQQAFQGAILLIR
jgi:gliding motility-associated-like protein